MIDAVCEIIVFLNAQPETWAALACCHAGGLEGNVPVVVACRAGSFWSFVVSQPGHRAHALGVMDDLEKSLGDVHMVDDVDQVRRILAKSDRDVDNLAKDMGCDDGGQ